jgi:hypothetical protein
MVYTAPMRKLLLLAILFGAVLSVAALQTVPPSSPLNDAQQIADLKRQVAILKQEVANLTLQLLPLQYEKAQKAGQEAAMELANLDKPKPDPKADTKKTAEAVKKEVPNGPKQPGPNSP